MNSAKGYGGCQGTRWTCELPGGVCYGRLKRLCRGEGAVAIRCSSSRHNHLLLVIARCSRGYGRAGSSSRSSRASLLHELLAHFPQPGGRRLTPMPQPCTKSPDACARSRKWPYSVERDSGWFDVVGILEVGARLGLQAGQTAQYTVVAAPAPTHRRIAHGGERRRGRGVGALQSKINQSSLPRSILQPCEGLLRQQAPRQPSIHEHATSRLKAVSITPAGGGSSELTAPGIARAASSVQPTRMERVCRDTISLLATRQLLGE